MNNTLLLSEGARYLYFRVKRGIRGYRRYTGGVDDILKAIIKNCWNGRYLQVSAGHFCQFWSRDIGMFADDLIELGRAKEVLSTYQYALPIFRKHRRVATAITPSGKPFDFPGYAPDSLLFLLRGLSLTKDKALLREYSEFLSSQIKYFYEHAIEKETGMIRRDTTFSSIRDHAVRHSSCYDNVAAAMISNYADELHLENPLSQYNYKKILRNNFWNGSAFTDSLDNDEVTGDANTFPFFFRLFSRKMFRSALDSIKQESLDSPLPLRYSSQKRMKRIALSFIAPGYESDKVWVHLGFAFMKAVYYYNSWKSLESYIYKYSSLVQKERNLLEVFNKNLSPYMSVLYKADESLVWAAALLNLRRKTGVFSGQR